MKIVTTDEMFQIERSADVSGISFDTLMENAGSGLAAALKKRLSVLGGRRLLILVGSGNNGGDGLIAARHLSKWGFDVTSCLLKMRSDDDPKLKDALQAGMKIVDNSPDRLFDACNRADLIVDAVLGTGQSLPIRSPIKELLHIVGLSLAEADKPVFAVDIPTGVDANSGQSDPSALKPDVVFALGCPKRGLYLQPIVEPYKAIEIISIGIPEHMTENVSVELLGREHVALSVPSRPIESNKGTFGKVLIVAGSPNYVGAAILAATGAYKSGVGLVTLATPQSVYRLIAGQLTDAVYLPLAEICEGQLNVSAASNAINGVFNTIDAALVGPGLGESTYMAEFLGDLLISNSECPPLVLDADALNFLSKKNNWWKNLNPNSVVTPHPGEMARLIDRPVEYVQGNRLKTAMEASRKWSTTVVLKGACTIIANPAGQVRIAPFANSGLATAGTGDVLAGMIVSLIAQGVSAYAAACLGVYAHGLAGDKARDRLGEAGMMASDLLGFLPTAFMELDST